ncbi:cupin domain-containing protein [Mycobacterium sp. NPDC006124]|uniref:(R)-mandelonitrile lyase n=1 Tax=Mycobacterium sp. NPDC006124 TaxID=3156729 RepID=UPI0033AE6254
MYKTLGVLAAAVSMSLNEAGPAGADDSIAGQTMEISPNDARPAGGGPAETFTGAVTVKPLFDPNGVRTFGSAEVSFTPCARTAWHTHPAGQTLVVLSGSGWIQQWDGMKQSINPGDVIWTPPGVKHWHGATEDAAMTHIAIQGTLDGKAVDWMEHVTDAEYKS